MIPVSHSKYVEVPRPTEHQAIRNATADPAPVPSLLDLFEGVLNASATGDNEGLSRFGHAIARISGGTR